MEFENKYYTSKEMYKEYINKVLYKNLTIYGYILSIGAIILCAITFKEDIVAAQIELTISLFVLFSTIFMPRVTLSKYMELDNKLHNGERPQAVVTFNERITLKEGNQNISIEYSQITKYYRLKSCSILMFSSQNGILFVEDNFTKGSKEEFEKFILEKCPQIKEIKVR